MLLSRVGPGIPMHRSFRSDHCNTSYYSNDNHSYKLRYLALLGRGESLDTAKESWIEAAWPVRVLATSSDTSPLIAATMMILCRTLGCKPSDPCMYFVDASSAHSPGKAGWTNTTASQSTSVERAMKLLAFAGPGCSR